MHAMPEWYVLNEKLPILIGVYIAGHTGHNTIVHGERTWLYHPNQTLLFGQR